MMVMMMAITKQQFKDLLPLCNFFCELSEGTLIVKQLALSECRYKELTFLCAIPLPAHQKPPCPHLRDRWPGEGDMGPESKGTWNARLQDRS